MAQRGGRPRRRRRRGDGLRGGDRPGADAAVGGPVDRRPGEPRGGDPNRSRPPGEPVPARGQRLLLPRPDCRRPAEAGLGRPRREDRLLRRERRPRRAGVRPGQRHEHGPPARPRAGGGVPVGPAGVRRPARTPGRGEAPAVRARPGPRPRPLPPEGLRRQPDPHAPRHPSAAARAGSPDSPGEHPVAKRTSPGAPADPRPADRRAAGGRGPTRRPATPSAGGRRTCTRSPPGRPTRAPRRRSTPGRSRRRVGPGTSEDVTDTAAGRSGPPAGNLAARIDAAAFAQFAARVDAVDAAGSE